MNTIKKIVFDHCSVYKATYEGGYYMKPHVDEESKISVILEGCLLERTTGNYLAAGKGSVVIKPNHVVHENLFGLRGSTILSLSFAKDYPLPQSLATWAWIEHPQLSFHALRLWYVLKSSKNDKQLDQHITQFTKTLQNCKKAQENNPPLWLQEMKTNLDSGDKSLNRIACLSGKMNSSRVYLSRTFKKHYLLSPVTYRNFVRLKQLLLLITDPDKSLAAIAYDCGFSDQSHMTRIIQREMGLRARELQVLARNF